MSTWHRFRRHRAATHAVGAMALALLAGSLLLGSGDAEARKKKHPAADTSGKFDYYVLSLSWSPVYCQAHSEDTQQCGARRFGFVLHGLWPQYANGGYPQTCATSNTLTESDREAAKAIFPSEKLVAHEWQKHGTCSGMRAKDYFETADQARNSIAVPASLEPGDHVVNWTAANISKAIRDANGAVTNRSLTVICSGPQLSEVRVCLDKSLKPMACGSGVKDACRAGPVRIPGAHG